MKYTVRQAFDLHICTSEPEGNEVIAFEVYHRWKLPECRPGVLDGQESCLRMEGHFLRDDESMELVGFPIRHTPSKKVVLGCGKRRARFQAVGSGSGGNCYWEVILFQPNTVPHVFNWLRRQQVHGQPMFSPTEWNERFYAAIWKARRALDRDTLFEVGKGLVRDHLRNQAAAAGCDLKTLIQASKPHGEA